MNFAQLKFLLTGLTLLTVLAACSDDDTSTEAPPATIEIAELSPEADNVSFRLIPTNAISMAYKIEIERGGGRRFRFDRKLRRKNGRNNRPDPRNLL